MIYDKASLVQIPSGYKSGTLYSVVPNTADGDFTVTGDPEGEATRVNKDGLIESVAADVPRLNYNFIDGVVQPDPHLLLEPTRANQVTKSKDFEGWQDLSGSEITTNNNATAPDGTNTAATIEKTGSDNTTLRFYTTYTNYSTVRSASIYIKKLSGSPTVSFGITDTQDSITPTDEWVRYTKDNVTPSNFGVPIFVDIEVSGVSGDKIAVWGAQLEEGTHSTSVIETSGSVVTRTVDKCFNGGDANLFNDSEGVVFLDIEVPNNSSEVKQTSLNNGTTNEAVKILQLNGTTFRFEVVMASGTNFSQDLTVNPYQRNKLALQYKASDYKVFVNGTKQSVTQRSTLPIGLDRFNFNRGFSTTDDFTGNVYQLMVFNEALSDSELETITSYTSFNQMAKALLYTIE